MGWEIAWEYTPNTTSTGEDARNYRNIIPADSSSYSGTKIRVTVEAGSNGPFVFDGTSIGLMTANDDYDASPTRITWDTGSSGGSVDASSSEVSDEITFSFDKTKRYGLHMYMVNRLAMRYVSPGPTDVYWDTNEVDLTMTTSVSLGGSYDYNMAFQKLEVYEEEVGEDLNVSASECE